MTTLDAYLEKKHKKKPDAYYWLRVHFNMTVEDVEKDIEKRRKK
jgi:hypothetical protein